MKRFYCDHCEQWLFFENVECVRCGHTLGYLPDQAVLSALEPAGEDLWRSLAPQAKGRLYRMCQNYSEAQVCNWMVSADSIEPFCQACRLNRIIPDLSQPDNLARWQRLESAKHRLVYSLLALGLPVLNKEDDEARGLAFDFLADPDPKFTETQQVMTGHANGVITINIAEADDVVREQRRLDLHELYRTVLGHFRHEIGHYYWEQLIRGSAWLDPCRALFGDEQEDYTQALQRHYEQGPPADWQQRFISAYASSHPWEDWAETWAHYLHMVDTLETSQSFGRLVASFPAKAEDDLPIDASGRDPDDTFETLMEHWLPLTLALNTINRSMGLKDLYPFVLSEPVIAKLRFVHQMITQIRNRA